MIAEKPSIFEALRSEGIELQQKGRDFWALCPFPGHTEKTASFKVSDRGFYCFGCNTGGGDAIDFVMKMYSFSFKDALAYLGIERRQTPVQARAAEKARRERERKQALVAAFREWEQETVNEIAEVLRAYRHMKDTRTTYTEAELVTLAELQGEIDVLEYHYEILCGRDDRGKFELYQEAMNAGSNF